MRRLLRHLVAPAVLGVVPLLSAGTLLAACDTGGCEGGVLQTEDLEVGEGDEATTSSTVRVAYTARLEDGTVFDENDDATLDLTTTIEGFREGVAGMREGGRRLITIPPELAYGEDSLPGTIPPCATLRFDVTLIDVS